MKQPLPPPERHRWLDQWLISQGEPLSALSGGLRDHLEGLEAATQSRKRARRAADQAAFRGLVDIITANLALAVLHPPPSGALAVRSGKLSTARSRYDHPAFGKQFRPLLDRLEETGIATLDVSRRRGEVSALRPTGKFADLVTASGVTLDDFGRHPDEECILLFQKIERTGGRTRHRVDYQDTETTIGMRSALRQVNAFVAETDIAFRSDGLSPAVNDRDRRLARYFLADSGGAPRFDQGGRLFGGFWLNLASTRRHAIRIEGEPVADLDFGSMFVRLAYAELGRKPPEGDLYALPGLEEHRSGVKLAMNTLFWDDHRGRKSWPSDMEGLLPEEWRQVSRLTTALRQRHPELQNAFGRGLGGTLMFRESEIMMGVLGRLMVEGVVALPLHDGLMISRSKADRARAIMIETAEDMAGVVFPVSDKPIALPELD